MTWREVYRDTDKTIEHDDTGQQRITWTNRYAVEPFIEAQAALMENAHEDGQPWAAPQGAHNAYPLGRTVTHNGATWENITPANVWEPGVSGWREVVSEGYPAWIRPTGAHDAYSIGDRVTFEGSNYESLINGNTYSPTEYPAGWTLIP